MRRILLSLIAVLILCPSFSAQTAPDAPELTRLLNDFLAGASKNDAAMHERFWADDLIYTGAVGRRIGKADIMDDVRKSPTLSRRTTTTTYTAEEVRIQQYGNTAIVAFRLVSTTEGGEAAQVTKYFNTGTFLKRNGKWQAVAWQATKIPAPDLAANREVASAEAAFQRAVLAADADTLERVLDESFIWTHSTGEQHTRQLLIDDLKAGRLKFSKLETNNVNVSVAGDTAIVRGVSPRQRSAIPGQSGPGDAAPFTSFYTLTLVNKRWRMEGRGHAYEPAVKGGRLLGVRRPGGALAQPRHPSTSAAQCTAVRSGAKPPRTKAAAEPPHSKEVALARRRSRQVFPNTCISSALKRSIARSNSVHAEAPAWQSPSKAPPPPNSVPQTERCLNCGAELSGEYCNQCGQKKVHRHDFSLKHFFGHLLHEITHLDSNKILKTLYALVFRPGLLTAEYLAGPEGQLHKSDPALPNL